MTQERMTYHLRRLRLHGLIERVPGTFRYEVSDFGLRSALFLTRAHQRVVVSALADAAGPDPPVPSQLRRRLDALRSEIDNLAARSRLAA
jgi:hypothetical protein